MDMPNFRFFYRDHMLSCRPFELDDGRFQARVAITAMGSLKTRAQRFLDLEEFDSFDDAVSCAHAAGIAWVDANAPMPTVSQPFPPPASRN